MSVSVLAAGAAGAPALVLLRGVIRGRGCGARAHVVCAGSYVVVRCDITAGRVLALRARVGKTTHIDVDMRWIQETPSPRNVDLRAISTLNDLADIGTKSLAKDKLLWLATQLGVRAAGP